MSDTNSKTDSVYDGSSLITTILEKRMRDIEPVQQIKQEILAAINAHPVKNVIVNLQHVAYIGSHAFLAFLAIRRQPNVERIVLCHLDDNVYEVFLICKLIPTQAHPSAPFEVAATVEDAKALLN